MSALEHVGKAISGDRSVARLRYVTDKAASALTQTQVDSRVASLLSSYATKSSVDAGDADGATLDYVDQQDALRVPLAWKGAPNGVATLGSNGIVPTAQLTVSGTQRLIKKMYSPSSYGSGTRTVTSDVTLFTVSIADPGWPYRLQAFGFFNTLSSSSAGSAVVSVRVNSSTGPTISRGYGRQTAANWGDCTVVPYERGEVLTGASTLYWVASRSSTSVSVQVASLLANAYVQVIPA